MLIVELNSLVIVSGVKIFPAVLNNYSFYSSRESTDKGKTGNFEDSSQYVSGLLYRAD